MRQCIFCRKTITHCNGFCLARDILKILRGERDVRVREMCGRCVEVVDMVVNGDDRFL